MKMTLEHQEYLKEKLNLVLAAHPGLIADYESGNFANSEKTKDLQTRFNFDLLYFSISSSWICKNLYPYLNDSHIASALRKILPTLNTTTFLERKGK